MQIATAEYAGKFRVRSIHTSSGNIIQSDAPKDNEGEGMAFSPTDLCATSLANCMMTVMAIKAKNMGIEEIFMQAEIGKEMAPAPRRIIAISVNLTIAADLDEYQQKVLQKTGEQCPVALSLHPAIKQQLKFEFQQRSKVL